MANKRQKKKQQKQEQQLQQVLKGKKSPGKAVKSMSKAEKRKAARDAGMSLRDAQKLADLPPAAVKTEIEREKRRQRDQKRIQRNLKELLAAGYTQEEAHKLRRKSQKDIAALAKKKRDEATASGDVMLVFVKDKTGGRVDAITGDGTGEWSEAVYWQKQMAKGLGIASLLKGINSALDGMDAVGNIGESVIDVVPAAHVEQTINFRAKQDYFLVYRGQGRSYKSLISLINNVMSFLYLRSQRDVFIRDLHANLYNLGNAAARRNADRIEKEFL